MKVTVFTGNQPRHLALVERLTDIATEVWSVHECLTVFPGEVEDFYRGSPTMQAYFGRVMEAERDVFGAPRFGPENVRQLLVKDGDLNRLSLEVLAPAMSSDAYVVFGASYIKGPLIDALVARRCVNLHMGVAPYYRGNSTNFWPLWERKPEFVGATIHLLTRGLDSGPILFHALPAAAPTDPFRLGMEAVRAAIDGFVARLVSEEIWSYEPMTQDRSKEFRYTRRSEFTDDVASSYLASLMSPTEVGVHLNARKLGDFVRPYVPD